MGSIEGFDSDGVTIMAEPKHEKIRLRAYQAEMLEESMKANIIVAQDTGSGKTYIALARTAAELETCDPSQRVWFLAPTVALCEQQTKFFESHLPGYAVQMLSGKDNVDHWSDQSTWDSVLAKVRIVLSTHQVLLDALTHGFVKMGSLALIIFDEAHHCTLKHPANLILANFYHPNINKGMQLPRILGLSASPVMRAKASTEALEEIERNMGAITKTPKLHRSELLQFVHEPKLVRVEYPIVAGHPSLLYRSLKAAQSNYDMSKDPYVINLQSRQGEYHDVDKRLGEAYCNKNTYCVQQLKMLVAKYKDTAEELGISVADWYIQECITQFRRAVQSSDQLLEGSHMEKQHLQEILGRLPVSGDNSSQPMILKSLSPKVETLIDVLALEADPNLTGLVFVEQKAWVTALAEILALHPKTRGKISIGTFIGSSVSMKRKTNIATLLEPQNKKDTLDKFRSGETNLILTTNVLEEGIDISSCHLVVCFEPPKNLKSFVQRRGRARRQESKYFIFMPGSGRGRSPATWQSLEEEMKAAYLDDLRHVQEAEERELVSEDGDRFYEIASTGALLTFDNAPQHLHHFCSLLASGPYVDTRPQFGFEVERDNIVAEVTLPLSVDPALRTTRSLESWKTERMAIKDAAFEAYKMLHQNGLVNNSLLPFRQEYDDQAAEFQIADNTPSLVEVSPTLDPWPLICREQKPHLYHRTLLEFHGIQNSPFCLDFLTPVQLPQAPDIALFWNESMEISVKSYPLPAATLPSEEIATMREITKKILNSIHATRMQKDRDDFPWLLVPSDLRSFESDHSKLVEWNFRTTGLQPAHELISQGHLDLETWGQVTVQGDARRWFPKLIDFDSSDGLPGHVVHVTRVPKRRDFLHRVVDQARKNHAYTRTEVFPASRCFVDKLPVIYSCCALLIPSILHRYETYLTTNILRTELLAPLSFEPVHLSLLVQALTSSSSRETANYQRLEFLGDCILKLVASVHLMADKLNWPENFLTGKKGKIVSNGFAARATLASGLDKFILREDFTSAKWSPHYTNDILSKPPTQEKQTLSSKTLADVVESLIGASYLIGGFPKAFTCIQTLLPSENWTPMPQSNQILYDAAPGDTINGLSVLEELVGYTFVKKSLLLEALTHASYAGLRATCSYERLEFLGDAVLDYIIVKRLYAHTPELTHQTMHAIRTAMANAAFLSFTMFSTTVDEARTVPHTTTTTTTKPTRRPQFRTEIKKRCLWQFLRSGSYQLVAGRDAALAQHDAAKHDINTALRTDARFPWHILALTDSPKFLSDIVESVIGAIYTDTRGDVAACEVFVRRLGILECLERILSDGVDCLHPKERLGHLAVEKDVQYVKAGSGEMGVYKVQVKVGGEDVGGVVEGLKRLNAETIAAWKAVGILENGMFVDGEMETEDEEQWFDAEDGGGIQLDAE